MRLCIILIPKGNSIFSLILFKDKENIPDIIFDCEILSGNKTKILSRIQIEGIDNSDYCLIMNNKNTQRLDDLTDYVEKCRGRYYDGSEEKLKERYNKDLKYINSEKFIKDNNDCGFLNEFKILLEKATLQFNVEDKPKKIEVSYKI